MNEIVRKLICSIVSVIAFGTAIYFSFGLDVPNSTMTGMWLTFSLFVFVLGWPGVADSISFLGNNIKLREISSSLKEMRQVIEADTRAIFELVQTQMRFGGVSDDQKEVIYYNLTEVLKRAGFSGEEIENIQERWHYWIRGDYVRNILANNIYHSHVPKEKKEEWPKKRQELRDKVDDVTPDELREAFKAFDGYTDEVKELINDFEYYRANYQHRRPEIWADREYWFKSEHMKKRF